MIKSAVTVSLVEEARGGPFVFWHDLPAACAKAASIGYDAIELFAPAADAVDPAELKGLLEAHGLGLAAVGTGAGMVIHGLSLTADDAAERAKAQDFVKTIIDLGGPFGAPAIIGSMQGRVAKGADRREVMGRLVDALKILAAHAAGHGVPLIYEPLNRYETNLINTVSGGVDLIESQGLKNVVLLADLFHMNIEEQNLAEALCAGAGHIGHIHFVDSNRRPAGFGHMDYAPIAKALEEIGYDGYASAEAFSCPDPVGAAQQTMDTFKKYLKAEEITNHA